MSGMYVAIETILQEYIFDFSKIFHKFSRLVASLHIMMVQTHAGSQVHTFWGQNSQNYQHIDFLSQKQHLRGLLGALVTLVLNILYVLKYFQNFT
jgi:hypothetical protein